MQKYELTCGPTSEKLLFRFFSSSKLQILFGILQRPRSLVRCWALALQGDLVGKNRQRLLKPQFETHLQLIVEQPKSKVGNDFSLYCPSNEWISWRKLRYLETLSRFGRWIRSSNEPLVIIKKFEYCGPGENCE